MRTPKLIQKSILEKGRYYYQRHIEIVINFFPVKLTPKEVEFVAAFMEKDPDKHGGNRFSTTSRKEVREELGLTYGNMSNLISSCVEKAALKKEDKKIFINPLLFPNDKEQYYQFKLQKD